VSERGVWLFVCCVALLAMASSSGCAPYQFGTRSLYRPDVRTVHVPIVQSDSLRRNLGERLTEHICKQIELKTPYKLVDADVADSILTARIVSENKKVLAENGLDEARDVETDFFVQVSWVDRRGDLIMSHTDVPVQPLLINVSQATNFVPEGGQSLVTSHEEALQRLADQIVGHLEMPW
jgi:hypothetical protein